ncbi:putative galacturonosyltransferase 15 isoform X1 [Nicotiana tabacum]|uniref:Hexosyltransferase n=2 Tax=Nicotiana tabacum TaxID=4097 RepID=A0A1S4A2W7_TOBAC|nr:probable galacturonosyltransferase 15 isoform X1 [Nicotiana tomentosiformis]XP_016471027.1 PREDICTED: probable galacturonosyltransferase 15 isoform X1 [Nicotiana tabacum]XP_016471036.1 PREDICTED: probable galacturonosyltransferase 15 isoform X1 [Nicotiana tabacum]XP_018629413.1 probable galacturonosyltransferase 15 isoform X1 [Nicotiana tomentosiformis]
MMKMYISATGIKKLTISSTAAVTSGGGGFGLPVVMKGKGSSPRIRRISYRTLLLPSLLVLGLLLSLLFFRITFIMLESAAFCSSSIGCLGWSIFGGSDSAVLREELMLALVEATSDGENGKGGIESSTSLPSSFNDLVKDMTSSGQDIKAFAFKTKAMIVKMEKLVESARQRESIFWHLASHGVPKGIHCLSLKLAEEYAENAAARSRLPPPQYVSRLTDPSFHHVVLLTDNVLAASVVVSSTIKNSSIPERLVFHIVTDKKTYTAMHAWFAVNSVNLAVLEVRGLHQFDWSHEVNIGIKEMIEIHRLICRHKFDRMKRETLANEYENDKDLQYLRPSCASLLNHLRIYIPELFPDLNKIIFLDDDTVVQHDLSSLWELDLNGKVVGAAFDSGCGDGCCPGRKYKDYFNFTSPVISSNLDYDRCGWLYGMNVFDLQAWRKTNITATYHHWLKLSLNSGFELWNPGALPPSLIAFEGHVHWIEPSWHIAGLGYRSVMNVTESILENVAVVHFSGPAKPWLEIGSPEIRSLWSRHVNFSNEYIRKCGIMG